MLTLYRMCTIIKKNVHILYKSKKERYMFCKNCGKEIDDNAVICPNCGVATDKFTEAAPTNAQIIAKKTNVFAIVGFVLSLVAGAFAYINTIVYWIALVVALGLSITGIVWSVKRNANLKGLAIAGVVISAIDIVLWIFLLLFVFSLVGALM